MAGIVATIGPSSWSEKTLKEMNGKAAIARFNGAWFDKEHFPIVRNKLSIPVLLDIPGARTKARQFYVSDDELVEIAKEHKLHYVGLSYVKSKHDVLNMKEKLKGSDVKVVAKIETAEAMKNLHEIIPESDLLLIDRGDLGTAIGFENVPKAQIEILKVAKQYKKEVIVATEMMMSTLNSAKPNCADVSDVYYALAHGADYVMLSEETAIGKDPLNTVGIMQKIIDAHKNHSKQ